MSNENEGTGEWTAIYNAQQLKWLRSQYKPQSEKRPTTERRYRGNLLAGRGGRAGLVV